MTLFSLLFSSLLFRCLFNCNADSMWLQCKPVIFKLTVTFRLKFLDCCSKFFFVTTETVVVVVVIALYWLFAWFVFYPVHLFIHFFLLSFSLLELSSLVIWFFYASVFCIFRWKKKRRNQLKIQIECLYHEEKII